MLGAITGSYFTKYTGRVRSIIIFEFFRLLVTFGYGCNNLYLLYVTRLFCGFTVGNFNCFCPLANRELLPKSIISFGGIMFYGSVSLGILLTSIFGAFLDVNFIIQYSVYFLCGPIIVSLLRIGLFLFIFRLETPQFILEKFARKNDSKGNNTEERVSIDNRSEDDNQDSEGYFSGLNLNDKKNIGQYPTDDTEILKPNKKDRKFSLENKKWTQIDHTLQKIYQQEKSEEIKEKIIKDYENSLNKQDVSIFEIFGKKYIKKVLIGLMMNWFHQFNGINFFIMYTGQTFDAIQPGTGNLINFFGAVVILLSIIPSIWFSNRFGRKFNLLFGISSEIVAYSLMILFIKMD